MNLVTILLPLLAQASADIDAVVSAGNTSRCAEPTTQQAMNYCAAQEWERADAALNRQWRATAAEMRRMDAAGAPDDGRPGYFSELLRGQRAWLVYRDHHCTSVGNNARGGSMQPLLVANCKTHLTRTRTAQLRELVDWPN